MIFNEMLMDERREGKAEGKAEDVIMLLEDIGFISDDLREKIMKETDFDVLKRWLKLAIKAESVEQFINEM